MYFVIKTALCPIDLQRSLAECAMHALNCTTAWLEGPKANGV